MIFKWLARLFNKFIRIFKEFMAVAFPIAKRIIIAQLKEFAVAMVSKLENTDLSNSEKRERAFREIEIEARRRGLQVKTSLVYFLIELSLQYIKEKTK